MFTCIIVDDDIFSTTHLRRLISDRIDLSLVRTFTKPTEALEFLKSNAIDIVFLDIYLPGILGTSFAKLIPNECLIIFTTVSDKEALEAFNVNAIDYLLKPIIASRLDMAIKKSKPFLKQKEISTREFTNEIKSRLITIIADRKIYKIPTDEIEYIESQFEYVCYHTKKIKLLSLGALKDVSVILPSEFFVRIHKSYIINIQHLRSYSATTITLNNGIELPIGRVYKENFKEIARPFK